MGARPTSFKKGGGFLNNVDGVITAITFTDANFDGTPFKPGKVKDPKTGQMKDRFHSLLAKLSVRPDGADEDVETHLFAGGADDFKISDDGAEVWDAEYETAEEAAAAEEAFKNGNAGNEPRQLGAGTSIAKLVSSAVDAGFPANDLPEFGINFSAMAGWRCRFVQKVNAEDTKKLGKRVDPKTKKQYDRNDLIIEQVYGKVEGKAGETGGKGKAATAGAKGGKGKAVEPAESDIETKALETLQAVLKPLKGKAITKKALGMASFKVLIKDADRDKVRAYLFDDDNLEAFEAGGYITFDKVKGEIVAGAE